MTIAQRLSHTLAWRRWSGHIQATQLPLEFGHAGGIAPAAGIERRVYADRKYGWPPTAIGDGDAPTAPLVGRFITNHADIMCRYGGKFLFRVEIRKPGGHTYVYHARSYTADEAQDRVLQRYAAVVRGYTKITTTEIKGDQE